MGFKSREFGGHSNAKSCYLLCLELIAMSLCAIFHQGEALWMVAKIVKWIQHFLVNKLHKILCYHLTLAIITNKLMSKLVNEH
jgi:hypothetical protein